jgi:hypothetical protein
LVHLKWQALLGTTDSPLVQELAQGRMLQLILGLLLVQELVREQTLALESERLLAQVLVRGLAQEQAWE